MNRWKLSVNISFILIGALLLLMLNSPTAWAAVTPILPFDNSLAGLDYQYDFNDRTSAYIGAAYDLGSGAVYQHLGARFFQDRTSYDLNVGYWLNIRMTGYMYQKGFEGTMVYQPDLSQNIYISIFDGDTGHNLLEQVGVDYLYLGYQKKFANDWERSIGISAGVTAGKAKLDNDWFYLFQLYVPFRMNNFKLISTMGYLTQTDSIGCYYDLGSYLRGYPMYSQTGDRVLGVTLEQQIPLFLHSENPVLGLLSLVGFLDTGGILAVNQAAADFKMHSSAGIGIVANMGGADLGITEVFTDFGEWKTLFYCRRSF